MLVNNIASRPAESLATLSLRGERLGRRVERTERVAMSFMDAREHGSKIGGAGVASAQVRPASEPQSPDRSNQQRSSAASSLARPIEPSLNLPIPLFLRSTRPSTAGRGSEDWRWRRSTSRRTRTSCETTSEGTTQTPPFAKFATSDARV